MPVGVKTIHSSLHPQKFPFYIQKLMWAFYFLCEQTLIMSLIGYHGYHVLSSITVYNGALHAMRYARIER